MNGTPSDVGFSHFSDTILLWAPLSENHVSPFLARCADVFLEALSLRIPLRGAVAVGEAVLNRQEGVFLGTPLIDAARLEYAQDWIGIALTRSCAEILPWLDSSLAIPYTPPCKPDTRVGLLSGFVLDWPRRARTREIDAASVLDAMRPSESYRKYYDHARAFLEHSARNQRWNRDVHVPISVGFLTRSVIRACLDGATAPPEVLAMLDSMTLNGESQITAAACFRALLEGSEVSDDVETLPQGPREHIRMLQRVIAGDFIDIDEITMAALEHRQGISHLTRRHQEYLSATPSERNRVWQHCIPFLRALADGTDVPDVPRDLPPEVERSLRQAYDAAQWRVAPVDMEGLISGIIWANTNSVALSGLNLRRLDALAAMGSPWDSVARFLRAVAEGSDIDVEMKGFDEGALSTIKVVRKILGWQDAARRSVADALKVTERIDGRLLHEAAVRVISAVRDKSDSDIESHIRRLEGAGSPHDAVARYFRHLLEERCAVEPPGGIGTDVSWYLRLTSAFAVNHPPEQSPVEYLVAVAFDARNTRRPLTPYEAVVFTLLGSAGQELGEFVGYLWLFATGETEPDIPATLPDNLRVALEEFREAVRRSKAAVTLDKIVETVLRCRSEGIEPEFANFLQAQITNGEHEGEIVAFLLQVVESRLLPQLPDHLDEEIRQKLMDTGIRALCEPLSLGTIVEAVLESRWYGIPLGDAVHDALEALTASGDPFRVVGRFLSDLAVPTLWPPIPEGVPRRTLVLLASARQHASDFARRVVAVRRKRADEGEIDEALESQ